jgi:hypothetical protein
MFCASPQLALNKNSNADRLQHSSSVSHDCTSQNKMPRTKRGILLNAGFAAGMHQRKALITS